LAALYIRTGAVVRLQIEKGLLKGRSPTSTIIDNRKVSNWQTISWMLTLQTKLQTRFCHCLISLFLFFIESTVCLRVFLC